MNPWIAVIGTLLGALIGGGLALLNAYLQLQNQIKRERQKLLLSKLEEMYELLSRIRKAYTLTSLEIIMKITGTESAKQATDETIVPIEKLQLLIGFYAPELSDRLELLEKCRNSFGDILGKSILLDKQDEKSKKEIYKALQPEWKKLDNACADIQKEVVSLSKKHL